MKATFIHVSPVAARIVLSFLLCRPAQSHCARVARVRHSLSARRHNSPSGSLNKHLKFNARLVLSSLFFRSPTLSATEIRHTPSLSILLQCRPLTHKLLQATHLTNTPRPRVRNDRQNAVNPCSHTSRRGSECYTHHSRAGTPAGATTSCRFATSASRRFCCTRSSFLRPTGFRSSVTGTFCGTSGFRAGSKQRLLAGGDEPR